VGVMLHVVDAASGAAAAGVIAGDIIVAVNGIECPDIASLEKLLEKAGGRAKLTVFRNNKYLQLDWNEE